MFKEIKFLLFLTFIFLFFFIISKHYISDDYKKKYFRTLNNINNNDASSLKKLPTLFNDTNNIIKFVDTKDESQNDLTFWKLIDDDNKE